MFPNKKYLFFNDGWEDIGKIKKSYDADYEITQLHSYCKTRVRIGKENGDIFKFCPKCKVKMNENLSTLITN